MHPVAAGQSFVQIFGKTAQTIYISHKIDAKYGATPRYIYNRMMVRWARRLMPYANVDVQISGAPLSKSPCLMVGNHISYLDIPLLMNVGPIVFVAKKEVGKYPIIGQGCRRINTVMVDRGSHKSRSKVPGQVADAILNRGVTVAMFPSGTTCMDETAPWRFGAFSIAKKYNIPIQPFVLDYSPLRRAAFIGDDGLVPHLWGLLRGERVKATLEIWQPRLVEDPRATANEVRSAIKSRLKELRTT